MKRIFLYVSIVLIVAGFIARFFADQYGYVSADGMLQDSAWLPIGTLMLVIGILALLVVGILYIISFLKNR